MKLEIGNREKFGKRKELEVAWSCRMHKLNRSHMKTKLREMYTMPSYKVQLMPAFAVSAIFTKDTEIFSQDSEKIFCNQLLNHPMH